MRDDRQSLWEGAGLAYRSVGKGGFHDVHLILALGREEIGGCTQGDNDGEADEDGVAGKAINVSHSECAFGGGMTYP